MINKDGILFILSLTFHLLVGIGAIGLGIEWIQKSGLWILLGVPFVLVGLATLLFYILAFSSYFRSKFRN